MDFKVLLLALGPRLKPHWMSLTAGIVGFVLLLYGLISFLPSSSESSDEIVIHSQAQEAALATTSGKMKSILIDISGAVIKPGVYAVQEGDRIQNAIEKAGGFSEDANTEYISKNINLAQKLTDGTKVYVPFNGETSTILNTSKNMSSQTFVNINISSSSMLEDLPGIGKVTAQKIIDNRPYGAIEELLEKKIVGNKVFEQIKDRVTVN